MRWGFVLNVRMFSFFALNQFDQFNQNQMYNDLKHIKYDQFNLN